MFLESTLRKLSIVLICLLSACAYQPISPTANAIGESISVGDTVRVTTADGRQQTITVTGMDATALRAGSTMIPYAQISELERREVNQPVIWLLVGAGAVAAAAGGGSGSY